MQIIVILTRLLESMKNGGWVTTGSILDMEKPAGTMSPKDFFVN